jgi:RNA polymerase sigma factor (sigma-70 family)
MAALDLRPALCQPRIATVIAAAALLHETVRPEATLPQNGTHAALALVATCGPAWSAPVSLVLRRLRLSADDMLGRFLPIVGFVGRRRLIRLTTEGEGSVVTPAPVTDAELIARTRAGDMLAYDELYRRHIDGANRVARVVTASTEEAQDVVSEAFMRVLDRLQHGGGPEGELSPYLNTIVRRLAIDRYRASRRLPAEPTLFEVMPVSDDPIAHSTDRDLVRRAFETLPDRWQQVLWHTEIEGRSPASLAPTLGSTPNAVAALAYRAREGLRQAYLSVHLSADIPEECRPAVPKLAAYVRSTLSPREDHWVAAHLESCQHCRERRDELTLLVADLRGVLLPALLLPVVLEGTKTAAAAAGATGAAAAGISGAEAGIVTADAKAGVAAVGADSTKAATAGTPGTAGTAAGAAAGVAAVGAAAAATGRFARVPTPTSLAGQIATAAAAVGTVAAVVVATAVIATDDDPPPPDQPPPDQPPPPEPPPWWWQLWCRWFPWWSSANAI